MKGVINWEGLSSSMVLQASQVFSSSPYSAVHLFIMSAGAAQVPKSVTCNYITQHLQEFHKVTVGKPCDVRQWLASVIKSTGVLKMSSRLRTSDDSFR